MKDNLQQCLMDSFKGLLFWILSLNLIVLIGFRMNWTRHDQTEAVAPVTPAPNSATIPAFTSKVKLLLDLWSSNLDRPSTRKITVSAPHLQDCKRCSEAIAKFDRSEDPWNSSWEGLPWQERGAKNADTAVSNVPWVRGGDEDNLPLTRRVQREIWSHQHPKNCSEARFLLAFWHHDETTDSVGVGSDMVSMAGMLAQALLLGRVFISKDYHGANHEGCTGPNKARWSCYFVPEASEECMERAMRLSLQKEAWDEGILQEFKGDQWNGPIPSLWGEPWKAMQPTVGLDGELMTNYQANHRRWWRAQALRYLTRFPSEYLCNLLNQERHRAFGEEAAKLAIKALPVDWPNSSPQWNDSHPMEELVWSSYGPWMPRPMVSIHVRQGDKAREMEVISFEEYMKLAILLRRRFPHVKNVWLSTEMQNVIDESKEYKDWSFYYTDVPRQVGTISMAEYMESLGKRLAFETSFVNLVMAAECDFFVGVLGSTWSYIIDDLRMTGGKVMAGFLSVNSVNALLKK